MKRFIFGLGLAVLTALPLPVSADLLWLKPTSISVDHFLVPPPKPGSEGEKSDIKTVLNYQTTRTKEDCQRALSEKDDHFQNLFGPPYGPLSADEVKKWTPFFTKIWEESEYFVSTMKTFWKRLRPPGLDPKVTPCVPVSMTSMGYPSGHTTVSRVFANLLSEMKPNDRTVLRKRADQIAEDRVISGVHSPTDIQAGKKLGDEISKQLLANPEFVKELKSLDL